MLQIIRLGYFFSYVLGYGSLKNNMVIFIDEKFVWVNF